MTHAGGIPPRTNLTSTVWNNFKTKLSNVGTAAGATKIKTVEIVQDKTIGRTNLDTPNGFYAGLVDIKKQPPVGSVDRYAQAAPELASWNGNLVISKGGQKAAVDYLEAYNMALKDYTIVAPHIELGMKDLENYMIS